MKTFFVILGLLIFLIVFLLFFRVRVSLKFCVGKENKSEIAFHGITLKKKESKSPKKKQRRLSFKRTFDFLFSPEKAFWKQFGYLGKKVNITKFRLNITVASEDAAQTALLYGSICSVLYPIVGYIETVIKFKEDDIKIVCDYNATSPDLDFFAEAKIRVFHLLKAGFKIIPNIKELFEEVKENEQ